MQDSVYIISAVGSVLITVILLSIVAVIVIIIKKRNRYRLQANSEPVAPLHVEIPQPLYETIPANAETECTTEGLGMEREYDTPDQTAVVVTSDKDDQNNQARDGANDIPGNVSHGGLADHHYEQVKLFDISHSASSASHPGKCTSASRGYCDGSVDLTAGEIEGAQIFEDAQAQALKVDAGVYERAQVYERLPNVNIAQMLSNAGVYERAQVYERVPNVNIAQMLSDAGVYERAQVYERVPNVNIAQMLSDAGVYEGAQVYERVPNVNIAQIPSQITNTPQSENVNSEAYEQVWYSEKTLQLIRGVMQPYEQISGYERVHYSETMEQIWRTIFGEESVEPYEQISGYERVQYSAEAMRLLKRMPHVATYADTDQNCGYERVQYCEEAVQLPHVATCADQTSGYDRVLHREQTMRLQEVSTDESQEQNSY